MQPTLWQHRGELLDFHLVAGQGHGPGPVETSAQGTVDLEPSTEVQPLGYLPGRRAPARQVDGVDPAPSGRGSSEPGGPIEGDPQ